MALILRKADITLHTLRPTMLLEDGQRLDSIMKAMQLFHPAQAGCRRNKGTEDAMRN
jgi:hypothetical protein